MRQAEKSWRLKSHDRQDLEELAAALRVSPVVAQLLLNRGMGQADVARRFLDAPLVGLHAPDLLPGVPEAADRLLDAGRTGRRVCVYGDYDVDGLTGTALLWQLLRLLEVPADFYVPNRLEEGYGLNSQALDQIHAAGAKLVVTVDCGIASLREAEHARQLGLELIVTDHHPPQDELPCAAVVVHPSVPGGRYPFGGLSGSGVAFKLAWALCQRASGGERVTARFREFLLEALVLAALGMVADVVPLHDENRIVVRHGLARLGRQSSVGLRALLEVSGLAEKRELCAADIGYSLAPRLNAAGRLGCARLVVELLTCASETRARDLARHLDAQNQKRQQIERRTFAEACELVAQQGLDAAPALVLANPGWHAGVIGIVAGRLAEHFARPVLLIAVATDAGIGQGSGRSVPGFALHDALRACGDGLISHGGHAAAAGFRIPTALVDGFRDRFCAYASQRLPECPVPYLELDAEVPLDMLTPGLVQALSGLEPYGAGNPRPVFLAGALRLIGQPRKVGGGERHLQFQVRQHERRLRAIAFGMGDRLEELQSAGGECCLAFTPSFNDWRGFRSVQLEVKDFRAGPGVALG